MAGRGLLREFVEEHLLQAEVLASRRENLLYAAAQAPAGLVLEFGVGDGESLGWLEAALPGHRIVGFDSFEGLPEAWRTGFGQGAFDEVAPGPFERAEVVVGWFEDTLGGFLAAAEDPIALLHVDCDLYSSTCTVLDHCLPRLAPGAVIVFDEFFNYPGWQQHEARAWAQYSRQLTGEVQYLAYVPSWEQITIRVG